MKSYTRPSAVRIFKILLTLTTVYLTGCAITPTVTIYELDSNPTGAEVYRGTTPENMAYYQVTPFKVNSASSLSWSRNYFQARKKGYKDSELFQQPVFALGTPSRIYFSLESAGGAEELARYKQMNSISGYYEFLQTYPDSSIKQEAYAAIVLLIVKAGSSDEEYSRLVREYPDAISFLPDDVKLSYIGPDGLKVKDVLGFLKQGIGEAIIEQKILSAEKPYSEFSFDEIRQLTAMGLSDKVIAAMLKVTTEYKEKSSMVVAPTTDGRSVQPQQNTAMQGYVAPDTAVAAGNGLGEKAVDCAVFLAKKKACDQLGMIGGMVCMSAIPAGHNCY